MMTTTTTMMVMMVTMTVNLYSAPHIHGQAKLKARTSYRAAIVTESRRTQEKKRVENMRQDARERTQQKRKAQTDNRKQFAKPLCDQ